MGNFVGSTSCLGASYQNKIHGLPLQLMIEECLFLLSECDDVRLIRGKQLDEHQIADYVSEFDEFEHQFLAEYRQLHRLSSIETISGKLQRIVEGKAKKAGLSPEQIDREQILKAEIERIKPIGLPKQLLIQSPWSAAFGELAGRGFDSELAGQSAKDGRIGQFTDEKKEEDELEKIIGYRSVLSNEHELLRCAVYADLNRKGLYLTKGNKFGSDFLAYPSDPLFVHALYLVVCLSENQQLSKTLLHTYTRLASQVNKHVLLVRFRTESGQKAGEERFDNRPDTGDRLNQADKQLFDKQLLNRLASKLEYMVIKWQS